MKYTILNLFVITTCLTLVSCGYKAQEHDMHDHESTEGGGDRNKPLYDEVMAVHDEIMPKLDDIYKLKESLKNKIADTPALANDKKQEIESTIVKLDSASEGMMDWMHKFSPLPDSTDETAAREYLEKEKVKIEKVKQNMLQALEKANALNR
ncbi:MAG: hypothetical protein ABI477_07135 [Chryseolinea sp.]